MTKKKATKARAAGAKKAAPRTAPGRKMPSFTKPSPQMVETFQRATATLPDTQLRQMFGSPAAFTNTLMFACVFQDTMIVRLSERDREALGREGARPFEPMPGRPMREYVSVPSGVLQSSALRSWLLKAHGYAASLPPKKKKR
jgi:TfoX/Sxy family transcriptional regulator of competence genes